MPDEESIDLASRCYCDVDSGPVRQWGYERVSRDENGATKIEPIVIFTRGKDY